MKKISSQSLTGQLGVNLIEKVVLEMGCLWYPTGSIEAGVDGYIELRDPITKEALNAIIQVQSKATSRGFEAETSETFVYRCDERDLEYWLTGTASIILVVSRPSTDEAYWVSVKDYFRNPEHRKSKKVIFYKAQDKFSVEARDRISELATSRSIGPYFAPQPKKEVLYSNLLAVTSFFPQLFIGETSLEPKEIRSELVSKGAYDQNEWIVRSKKVFSFLDLQEYPWTSICDSGAVDWFDTDEWAYSTDKERQDDFTWLLNQCLRARLARDRVFYSKDRDCYYFGSNRDLSPRLFRYQGLNKRTSRMVVDLYKKGSSRLGEDKPSSYKHSAFEGRFRRHDDSWLLQITPTYYYSYGGHLPDQYYESKLKGIKALENNEAVLGQVVMWAYLLGPKEQNLFGSSTYPYLSFGSLLSFGIDVGINDSTWLPADDMDDSASDSVDLPLFSGRV